MTEDRPGHSKEGSVPPIKLVGEGIQVFGSISNRICMYVCAFITECICVYRIYVYFIYLPTSIIGKHMYTVCEQYSVHLVLAILMCLDVFLVYLTQGSRKLSLVVFSFFFFLGLLILKLGESRQSISLLSIVLSFCFPENSAWGHLLNK